MRKILCAFFVLSFALLCATNSWSQSLITTGTVQGDVTDEKGGSIPDASAEIRNLDTNVTRSEKTSSDGHFAFLNLPPGRYTLTVTKQGFSIVEQQNINLTVGQQISLSISLKISAVSERVVVSEVPLVELTKTESSSTLNELSISQTPVLGRKFEDLLTLTPGVSVVQGPDGDEINFNGQRGVFNNISLDGGDYNNGFFGEQMGGQRAAIDITLDAVKEFQVVASGANAEYGRTAGGVVNVITKSGTNEVHGSAFYFQRLKALTSNTSDGKPLNGFHREQLGGTLRGPIRKDKMWFAGAFEHVRETLTRDNLSAPIDATPCPVSNPVFNSNITDAQIGAFPECQRLALLNFLQSSVGQNDGLPVEHPVRNSALLGRIDWNMSQKTQLFVSYNFDYSKNTNQTFDVGTYGNSANGIEGPSKVHTLNGDLSTTISPTMINVAHFSYTREIRPRSAVPSNIPADTAMGFGPTFRFGSPFFLNPNVDETIWRTQIRDSISVVHGKHTFKVGGEWLHTLNDQVFRGFFTGRYIFDSPVSFLHYASPAALGAGFGPTAAECASGAYTDISLVVAGLCPDASAFTGGPLIFFLQDGVPTGLPNVPAPGASRIKNEDYGLFAQDSWQVRPGLTLNYGLRWEAQIFPNTVVPPSQTAYAMFLSTPGFPTDGTEHSPKKELQPRLGLAWDVANRHKSVLRASWGVYYGRQNMLSQVGSITTNGVQQSTIYTVSAFGGGPVWPNPFPVVPGISSCISNPFPCFTGIRAFSKDYENPRIYTTNVGYEQDLGHNVAVYADFTLSKGVHMTRFYNANNGSGPTVMPVNGDTVIYTGPGLYGPYLGDVFITSSAGKSLYRGVTFGVRKRFSQKWQMEANYTVSKDMDDDSNERDPFTDRTFNRFDLSKDYGLSDRDQRHRVNFYTYFELPKGFTGNIRMQGHSAQPITPETRVQNGVDLGRNTLRKDNAFFSMDWRIERPFHINERMQLIPVFEMFNTFNNKNNVNPLTTPALFDFNGFLRVGVGDPRQAQFALRLTF
ncbi:MAG: TonB-dependent receptor [Acidobacteriia bacterium]|nr:TonB-dependent receptor [Terriglobia bacterium]